MHKVDVVCHLHIGIERNMNINMGWSMIFHEFFHHNKLEVMNVLIPRTRHSKMVKSIPTLQEGYKFYP
jgi:hypothetical protein